MSQPRRTSRRRAWTALTLPALLCVLAACSGGPAGEAAAPAPSASPTPSGPPGTLFDDFHYSGPDDPALTAHGWEIRTGGGGPGIKDTWSAAGAGFPPTRPPRGPGPAAAVLHRRHQAGHPAGRGAEHRYPLFTGTFAARVYLSDKPTSGRNGDHVVETFFPISASDSSANYSELDYEYLPNGGWGSVGSQLHTTSWYKADPPDRVTHALKQRLEGWHIMMITFVNGKVTYSLDGKELFTSSGKYVPREKMDIHFSNWFIDLPFTGGARTWNMKVNWFYYKAGEAVSQADVQKTVDGFYSAGINYINTVPKS